MELLRRALLLGCCLPGLWLVRLAPLNPLLTIVPVDFAARQRDEAAVAAGRASEEQRRRAAMPLSVYIEETLQYNVFPASGDVWDRFLADIDTRAGGAPRPRPVFLRADDDPLRTVGDRLAAAGGTTFISFSRPGRDVHYQVDRRGFDRTDFAPLRGFTGMPRPPASLLYPFRWVGLAAIAIGLALFFLLPGPSGADSLGGLGAREACLLAVCLSLFAFPLFAVGGAVQALTRALAVTLPCWLAAMVVAHVFAAPLRTVPLPAPDSPADAASSGKRRRSFDALFLRQGLVFLVVALGPTAFFVSVSFVLWNR